ncbi:2-oxoglutarate dehydrogenase, E2 component, dihydrolipoamide succinyltransferase [Mumia zhuanghuii]|uniref:Dihydrolipoamide acetyltransferase component of pyruvate dehydrogenase complex n=2 Tax=Mumia TaxID=1546255 RepID=A0ABW1QIS6_9ACTN|nr:MULTISPECIES: 2-oxoglutarate dehydrogenase, E2 component, dihydrolipoamide succinyltransferase [Mumia]KAA1423547.1 2-oxoglutarate dehydrogenase, E2 component, dihydrolipoamide succinyltransferase [Mumia zhuanghuii]
MATPVTLPELGESVTEGTVTRWLKQIGDTVAVDEPLLEVSTDKVDTEIPSPVAGVLLEISAAEDETVEVGAVLATIGEEGESTGDAAPAEEAPAEEAPAEEAPAEEASAEEAPAEDSAAPSEEAPEEPAGEASTPEGDETTPAVAAEQDGGAPAGSDDAAPADDAPQGEATPVTLPELGESVTEGTVTRWLKQIGDEVAVDEPLLEVSTDKVDTEIPSPVAGTLLEISAAEDETVAVGGQLALIGAAGGAAPSKDSAPEAEAEQAPEPEAAPEPEQAPEPEPEPKQEQQQAPAEPKQAPQAEKPAPAAAEAPAAAPSAVKPDGRQYVTPIVRKLAEREGVSLDDVEGTGVGGRIRKQDILDAAAKARAAAEAPAAAPAAAASGPDVSGLAGTVKKANRIRQLTAIKTKESLQVAAQLTQVHEVDLTRVAALRQKHKAAFLDREGVKLTFLPFIAKATVEALKAHPNVNASYDEESKEITYHAAINLGIAVDTERGLLSIVVHDAGDLSLAGLAQRIDDLASRARSGDIKPNELSGGTFTITNIGSFGGLFDTPILVQPQAAMLATGAVVKKPVVVTDADGNESIAIRSMAYLPMTYDHRLVDGADTGRFLTTVKKRLEEGAFEAELS